MEFNFANILVFVLVGAGFVGLTLFLGRLLRPSFPTFEKEATYECGEIPVSTAWINYNLRYYLVAIIFVIFDVEVAFVYPVAIVFKNWISQGKGAVALVEVLIFALILFVGLLYVWVKGDLNWVKKIEGEGKSARVTPEQATAL